MRGGTTNACANGSTAAFQSTRPVRGGTITGLALALGFTDFNPPAPCGAGRDGGRARHPQPDFNPPAPCGAGLRQSAGDYLPNRYFNPPAPCGAGQHLRTQLNDMMRISIHPPRAGRDVYLCHNRCHIFAFQSTRPVRGGTTGPSNFSKIFIFQSTRPVRGGTRMDFICSMLQSNFNPPAPCGAGRGWTLFAPCYNRISIHPPRAGRDLRQHTNQRTGQNFNPPAPCGAGLAAALAVPGGSCISIHPPRAGRDLL